MQLQTQFWRLRHAVAIGDVLDGWRVCWLGGWDKHRLFFIIMVERKREFPKCFKPRNRPLVR